MRPFIHKLWRDRVYDRRQADIIYGDIDQLGIGQGIRGRDNPHLVETRLRGIGIESQAAYPFARICEGHIRDQRFRGKSNDVTVLPFIDTLRRDNAQRRRQVDICHGYIDKLRICKGVRGGNKPDLVYAGLSIIGIEGQTAHSAGRIGEGHIGGRKFGRQGYGVTVRIGCCYSQVQMPAFGQSRRCNRAYGRRKIDIGYGYINELCIGQSIRRRDEPDLMYSRLRIVRIEDQSTDSTGGIGKRHIRRLNSRRRRRGRRRSPSSRDVALRRALGE